MRRLLDRRPVLLVEHDSNDEILTCRAIETSVAAAPIVVARSGAEALDYLDRPDRHHLPRLVLLDLGLPGVEGLKVLQRLRSNTRTRLLPVVILTNSEEEKVVVASYGLGANSYVLKPVRFAEFSKAVGMIAAYWLQFNESPPEPPRSPGTSDGSGGMHTQP